MSLNDITTKRFYEINGFDVICLKGNMTAKGLQRWFYKVSDFKVDEEGIINFYNEKRIFPLLQVYKNQITGVDFHSPIKEDEQKYIY